LFMRARLQLKYRYKLLTRLAEWVFMGLTPRLIGQSRFPPKARFAGRTVPVPVYSQFGLLYHIPIDAVAHYRTRSNAEVITRRGSVRSIFLHNYGSDYDRPPRHGNAQKTVHRSENADNPPRVWMFRELKNPCAIGTLAEPRQAPPHQTVPGRTQPNPTLGQNKEYHGRRGQTLCPD
jgi:hypothetical protein